MRRPPPTLFGSREARRARHDRMVQLRELGWALERIAEEVGLWTRSTVQHHLLGLCECYRERDGARAAEPSGGDSV